MLIMMSVRLRSIVVVFGLGSEVLMCIGYGCVRWWWKVLVVLKRKWKVVVEYDMVVFE